jgi:hypothetical protein
LLSDERNRQRPRNSQLLGHQIGIATIKDISTQLERGFQKFTSPTKLEELGIQSVQTKLQPLMDTTNRNNSTDDIDASIVSTTPDGTTRKRKRKTFACIVCRKRKLKCDQVWPTCTRCVKSNIQCIYGREDAAELSAAAASSSNYLHQTSNPTLNLPANGTAVLFASTNGQRPVPADTAANFVRATFSRSRPPELESTRDGVGFPMHPSINVRRKSDRAGEVQETMILKGQNFKTQYFGGTHPVSPIVHFPELRAFMVS